MFLSATIPNAREFAEWVAKTHRSPCHVVYTDYRPTPLQHYLFPAGGAGAGGVERTEARRGCHVVRSAWARGVLTMGDNAPATRRRLLLLLLIWCSPEPVKHPAVHAAVHM